RGTAKLRLMVRSAFLIWLIFFTAAAGQTRPVTLPSTQIVRVLGKPVPFLTADETIATFKLPPGLRIEVVANEPMVQHPVTASFDADGRLWVVEMRSYM